MQPEFNTFREAVNKYRGNLSRVATSFGVTRQTIVNWQVAGGDEWKQVVRDARMRLFDDSLVAGEALARGIPERDAEGNIIGWVEKPDGQMIRYFLSVLGREEGFGDTPDTLQDKQVSGTPKEIRVQVVYTSAEDLELQSKGEDGGEKKEGGE
jgi:hypothetical protein